MAFDLVEVSLIVGIAGTVTTGAVLSVQKLMKWGAWFAKQDQESVQIETTARRVGEVADKTSGVTLHLESQLDTLGRDFSAHERRDNERFAATEKSSTERFHAGERRFARIDRELTDLKAMLTPLLTELRPMLERIDANTRQR